MLASAADASCTARVSRRLRKHALALTYHRVVHVVQARYLNSKRFWAAQRWCAILIERGRLDPGPSWFHQDFKTFFNESMPSFTEDILVRGGPVARSPITRRHPRLDLAQRAIRA